MSDSSNIPPRAATPPAARLTPSDQWYCEARFLDPRVLREDAWQIGEALAWLDQQIPPYTFNGGFAYSLKCILCLNEFPHTQEQHDILRAGIEVDRV